VAPPSDGLVSVALVNAGIRVRHGKLCASRSGGACRCRPTYQANVWSAREGKRLFKTFATLAEAKAWRTDAQVALRRGTMRAGSSGTLSEGAEAWLAGVKSGAIRNRSGHPYKPSAIRGYETALVMRVLPRLGGLRFSEVRRVDLQDFADRLCADGLDPSTVRNMLMPLRAIFRRAVARGEVA
jgi:integrase